MNTPQLLEISEHLSSAMFPRNETARSTSEIDKINLSKMQHSPIQPGNLGSQMQTHKKTIIP